MVLLFLVFFVTVAYHVNVIVCVHYSEQIWVSSPHNANGYFTIFGDESLHHDQFDSQLATGDIHTCYARTGFLGFIRRTELTQSDGGNVVLFFIYVSVNCGGD